jgi:hypothetical protein
MAVVSGFYQNSSFSTLNDGNRNILLLNRIKNLSILEQKQRFKQVMSLQKIYISIKKSDTRLSEVHRL